MSPANMPICVLVMSSIGPRYLPTDVVAPRRFCDHPAPYRELQVDDDDISVAECVMTWAMYGEGCSVVSDKLLAATRAAHNAAAAARFLDTSPVECVAVNDNGISESDIYLGRSVLVMPSQLRRAVPGWIVSSVEPFDVVVVTRPGVVQKIAVSTEQLIEDGTAERLR